MMPFAFSCGDSASSSDNAATTIQNAGCCRNSTIGIAGLLSGYGRRRQRLDELQRQKAQGFAGKGAVAIGGSVLRVEDAD